MLFRGVIRTTKCHVKNYTQDELREDSPFLTWLVEHAGSILSRCQKGRDGRTPFDKSHGKKPTQEFVPFREKVLARPISSEPLNRMHPRYKFGVWLGVRSNSAECFVGTAEGVDRAREVRRIEYQDRDRSPVESCRWKMDSGQASDTNRPFLPLPPVPKEGARGRGRDQNRH